MAEEIAHFVAWLKTPKGQARQRRRTKMRRVDSLRERCEICLRSAEELPEPVELRAHHALEVQHGGDDSDVNRRVYCDDCHRLVHWARRALGREVADADSGNGAAAVDPPEIVVLGDS